MSKSSRVRGQLVAQTAEIVTRAPDQLGNAIQRCRKRTGMTQTELAKEAGLRQATISRIEQGNRAEISSIFSICAALGLELVIRERPVTKHFRPEEVFK